MRFSGPRTPLGPGSAHQPQHWSAGWDPPLFFSAGDRRSGDLPWGVGAGAASGRGCSGLTGSRRGSVGVAPGATPRPHTPRGRWVYLASESTCSELVSRPRLPSQTCRSPPAQEVKVSSRTGCPAGVGIWSHVSPHQPSVSHQTPVM